MTFFDFGVVTKQHHAHLVFLQVHGYAGQAVGERKKFAGHDFVQTVNPGDAIAQRNDGSDLVDRDFRFVALDLLADKLSDLVCFELSHSKKPLP